MKMTFWIQSECHIDEIFKVEKSNDVSKLGCITSVWSDISRVGRTAKDRQTNPERGTHKAAHRESPLA